MYAQTFRSDHSVIEPPVTAPVKVWHVKKTTKDHFHFSFHGLAPHSSVCVSEIIWTSVEVLVRRAMHHLMRQGYGGTPKQIKFESFDIERLILLNQAIQRFSWLVHNNERHSFQTTYCLDGNLGSVDFSDPNLYVNKTWADAFLLCAQNGIIEIEIMPNGRIRGVRWNSSTVQFLDLAAILRT